MIRYSSDSTLILLFCEFFFESYSLKHSISSLNFPFSNRSYRLFYLKSLKDSCTLKSSFCYFLILLLIVSSDLLESSIICSSILYFSLRFLIIVFFLSISSLSSCSYLSLICFGCVDGIFYLAKNFLESSSICYCLFISYLAFMFLIYITYFFNLIISSSFSSISLKLFFSPSSELLTCNRRRSTYSLSLAFSASNVNIFASSLILSCHSG